VEPLSDQLLIWASSQLTLPFSQSILPSSQPKMWLPSS
jgi:hypothetical protein